MRSSYGSTSKLFVGDFGDNRKSDLARLFSKYGEIATIYFDEHKHFAFIEFTSPSDAQRALERTQNKTLNGSKLRVEYAKPDKGSRDSRRPVSRDHSPTSALYSHLQVTANRLPPLQAFRQKYHQHSSAPITRNGSGTSRGRSLTPPSFKQNSYLSPMHSIRPPDFYYHHPTMYNDPAYYRTYGDPYLLQRLPPPSFLPSTSSPPPSSSRTYRNMYPSFGTSRYTSANSSQLYQSRRSRSRSSSRGRHRISSSLRSQANRERKNKRRSLSASSTERGPRTPPSKSSKQRSKERSRSRSDSNSAMSSEKPPSHSSTDESNDEAQQSSTRRSVDEDTDSKHSKNRRRE